MEVLYTMLELLVALLCCVGNVLVIWGVKLTRSLQQPTFCFVVSLAAADFLVGAIAIPMALVLDDGLQISFDGCLFISCLVLVLTQSSVLALLAIAVDRYLRVQIAFRYKRFATQSRTWAAVTASWVLACLIGFTPLLGWNNRDPLHSPNSTINCTFVTVMSMEYMVYFNFFVWILMPLLLMTILYLLVFYNIKKHLRQKESQTFYMKEQKLAKSLALVLALFAISWLPLHIMNCVTLFGKVNEHYSWLIHTGILLSHANSAVNPIVYAFKIRKLRKAYLLIWNRVAFCRTGEISQTDLTADQIDGSNPNSTISMDNRKIHPQGDLKIHFKTDVKPPC
ncbi:adenosine receptor A1 [Paramormyrops kingsleyae]|uniref:Adenosine receptor A1-like n=1 Tax=Paramormyrops kingsleyae TaxID=1676925 RepID=A0A3B3SJI0_9TELE|nr:adenosine receptor A1-like [Paramormyrops kingsleyae]